MTVSEKAYAKINLFLNVKGRREDGYHDIETLMQSVSLGDDITLSATRSEEKTIIIRSSDSTLKTDENNLIYKSAAKYMSYFDISAMVEVDLVKRIPIGAGLGGGSSDAAATLRAMNKIFGLATKKQLLDMAAEIGSDIPFCLVGGSALCKGRGERVFPCKQSFYPHIVIAIGNGRVSTPAAYALLDEQYGDFSAHNRERCYDADHLPLYNIFESVIRSDEIEDIKRIMLECGAPVTLMSGSGPSVFGGFSNSSAAAIARKALKKQGYLAFECEPIKENI